MENNKNIHNGHRKRLRELSANVDLDKLPEHQALELLLTFVIPRRDTNPIAHELINKFGSLSNVFSANASDLKKVKGIGESAAYFINLCSQIPLVYKKSQTSCKPLLNTIRKAIDYLKATINISSTEKLYLAYLNGKGELIKTESFGTGNLDSVMVDTKELIAGVLTVPTAGVIACHTHPHSNPTPSINDIKFTKQFLLSLNAIGVPLLDHIILSSSGEFSFATAGEIEIYKKEFAELLENVKFVNAPAMIYKEK